MLMLPAIGLAGLCGLAIVTRTALYYRGDDGPAFAITLVMGVALSCGLVELLWVTRRTGRLARELAELPREASGDEVDAASPLLRALLRARLDRTVLPVPGAVFAPYIVGLLIMLGLLGTFLGLFETLHGASAALSTGADVEALRAGLQKPLHGLMRSFGTSAAGVASSAMLGLCGVLARRAAGQLGVQLHTVASGPLASLSPARRQLIALEALAAQGKALPQAAEALAAATRELDTLRDAWQQSHEAAATQTGETLRGAIGEVRTALTATVDATARAAADAVTPLLAQGVRDTVAAATEHLDEVRGTVERDARRTAEVQHKMFDAFEARGKALAEATEGMHRDLADAAAVVRERLEQGADVEQAQQERAQELFAAMRSTSDEIASAAEAQVGNLQRFVESTDGRLREAEQASQARQAQLLEQLGTLAKAQTEQLSGFVGSADSHLREAEQASQARQAQLLEQLGTLAKAQTQQLSDFVGSADSHLREAEQASQARQAQLLERLGAMASAQSAQLSEFVESTDGRLREAEQQRSASQEALALQLAAAAEGQAKRLSGFVESTQAQLLTAEQTQQGRQSALLERLAEHVESHAERLGALVERTDGQLRAAHDASESQQQQALEHMTTLADGQAQRLAEFEERIAAQHAEQARLLAQRLGEHAGKLDAATRRSTELLSEAAALVHGGGAEMSAVAETFGAAVERQRQAADSWLESLGDIERSVTDAGEAAAADVLGQHLARTHEVFDRQLRFQQELLEQLRGTPGSAVAAGADDVVA